MSSPQAAPRTGAPSGRRPVPPGLLFALPFLVLFAVFMLWPLGQGLWMSLTDTSLSAHSPGFVGVDNFTEALGDAAMWSSLGHTVWFTLISTVPLVLVALVLALLV